MMGWDSPDQHGPEDIREEVCISVDDADWLEKHEAVIGFRVGNPMAIEIRRADGLRVQATAWTWRELFHKARALAAGAP
jgi:hypothetical protein